MIALDLDWTLLDANRDIPAENQKAIRRALDKGIVVVLASGRNASSIQQYWLGMDLEGPVVSCNGAFVLDALGEEVHHESVPDPIRDELVLFAEDADTHVAIYSRNRVLCAGQNEWSTLYTSRLRNFSPEQVAGPELRSVDATKVLFIDDPTRIQAHKDLLEVEYSAKTYMTVSEPEYLEFMAPTVDKSRGLMVLAGALGIDRSEVAAMGDGLNDLEMVQWAGFGAAPANAIEKVREAADRLFPSNDELGAAHFIDSIVYNL